MSDQAIDAVMNYLAELTQEIKSIKAVMATKEDLAAMATKADIANMATKDDLAGMATKADIAAIRAELANETASLRANMATKADISELRQAVARIEVEHGQKIGALFDAFELRGDEIRQLREHMDARFDALAADISLLVKKSFQHDNEIRDLRRAK